MENSIAKKVCPRGSAADRAVRYVLLIGRALDPLGGQGRLPVRGPAPCAVFMDTTTHLAATTEAV